MNLSGLWSLARGGLNAAKDAALGVASNWFLNKFALHRLGKMTSLRIDTERQEIQATLDLHGEVSPIEVRASYRLFEEAGNPMMEITQVEASRPWITTLANEVVPPEKRRFVIPPLVKAALLRVVK